MTSNIPQYKMIKNFKTIVGERFGVHKVSNDTWTTFIYSFTDADIETISEMAKKHFGELLRATTVVRFDDVADRLSFIIGKSNNHATFEFNPKKIEMEMVWE